MKLKKLLPYLLLTSSLTVSIATAARSEEVGIGVSEHLKSTPTDANSNQPFTGESIREIQRISELVHPGKSAEILRQPPQLSQGSATEIVPVSAVKANPTTRGVEVILQTALGEKLQLVNRSSGNNFIADIPNAQLRLPSGDTFTFRSERPVAGITEITVANFDASTIRVTVIGEASVPTVELFDSPDEGLILSVASAVSSTSQGQQTQIPQKPEANQPEIKTPPSQPSSASDEPIELVVTGEQDGYSAPEASTGTRTDTPLRDIPQSIQVIPQQVIKDQGITRISDAVRNVSGATIQSGYGNLIGDVNLRGFVSNSVLRDGFITAPFFTDSANIDRVEVLKGPASVLYGQGSPGGIVNYITKQPLNEPYYSAEFTVGSYDFYKPTLDLSGPLTGDKRLLYRLNISNENSRSYRDFINNKIFFISPAFTYKISDATTLNFAYEYLNANLGFDRGFSPFSAFSNLPRNRNLGTSDDYQIVQVHRFNITLDQQLSDNLRLRSGFTGRFEYLDGKFANFFDDVGEDGQTLNRALAGGVSYNDSLTLQTDLIGKFKTGSIAHQLLFGFELNRQTSRNAGFEGDGEFSSINIFNPINDSLPATTLQSFGPASIQNTKGIYLQDQVTLLPNLKLLVGGRYDFINNDAVYSVFYDEAFSPRVGIVYQPIESISLYASYSKSFEPNNAQKVNQEFIEPSRSTQYEVGVKAELFDKRLSATLAAYDITKSNIATVDPENPDYSIPIGEVKSRGIELDIAGLISPGWKVIASGYLNDAYVSEDTDPTNIGRRFANAPYHGASLWTTYEIQRGDLQGLQFGAGLFFVGSRIANQSDPYTLPSYVRTDASISYKRDNWRAALNFKNIFNVNYSETNGYLIFPQAPFTLQGTISVSF
ncbi:TonB-dependent siderophore receptor [Nostoc sp. TCL240-02]|uniref:TonB-dependent siderophore receptor n=1 Tax=Nostoc sp. TCL240-02 TaxID=2572090 RepID=UPI00157FA3FB|nr:TonB-dependent siderophore receptor [Nostoc sp. TCL240-02]QKQ73073.1 TonB-dependent siderophore receptor [Nostoc sp. TCL240-02]